MGKREQDAARRRYNFARDQLGSMSAERRCDLTIDRVVASYGVSPVEASELVNKFAWRA